MCSKAVIIYSDEPMYVSACTCSYLSRNTSDKYCIHTSTAALDCLHAMFLYALSVITVCHGVQGNRSTCSSEGLICQEVFTTDPARDWITKQSLHRYRGGIVPL